MNSLIAERALWCCAGAFMLLTVVEAVHDDGSVSAQTVNARPVSGNGAVQMFDSDTLLAATEHTIANDLFRLERHPAAVPFSLNPPAPIAAMPTASTMRLVLQGTIGGPPWRAILGGVPGRDGTVMVQAGDTLAGITIKRVGRDSVQVRVKDSTWVVRGGGAGA